MAIRQPVVAKVLRGKSGVERVRLAHEAWELARDRLTRFLEQHSPEIVLVIVAPDPKVRTLPVGAYDEIYAESDIARMTQRIREQDPDGIVLPFEKPRPAG